MVTWLFSPWGIPADYRHMQGSGVNTYKLVDAHGGSRWSSSTSSRSRACAT
jgi:catalase